MYTDRGQCRISTRLAAHRFWPADSHINMMHLIYARSVGHAAYGSNVCFLTWICGRVENAGVDEEAAVEVEIWKTPSLEAIIRYIRRQHRHHNGCG